FLLDTHLRALGINPDESPEDSLTIVEDSKTPGYFARRNITKGAGEYGNTIGFNVGATLSFANTCEGYGVGDPEQDDSHFGLLPGFQLGAEANRILNNKWEASFGLLYNLTRISYSASPLSFTSYRYVESQQLVELPLSMIYKLHPDNRKVCYYLRGGFTPSYLFSASGKGTRTGEDDEVVVDRTRISA
ncbi:MAG: PorT family protein, partial [bacterium]|nr:PorT family protein [bacterium]